MVKRWLKSFGLFAGLLASALMGIDYPVSLQGVTATYTNQAGWGFSTNTSNETLIVTEMPFSHFRILTNGSLIHAGSNFILNLRAVDAWGYHVTLTHATNLTMGSFDSNRLPTSTNLLATQLAYQSPSNSFPDFDGLLYTNQYPVSGYIYISVSQTNTTNFVEPGLLTILPNPVAGILTFDRPRYLGYGASALLTLQDDDRNRDSMAIESLTVRVASSSDTNGKWVTLHETGPATGIFTNLLGFEGVLSAATNRVFAGNSNNVLALYDDPEPPMSVVTNSRFDLVQQVWVPQPVFMGYPRQTNLPVIGISADGYSNDMALDYDMTLSTEPGSTPSLQSLGTNAFATTAPGQSRALLSNRMDATLSTNVVFLVTIQTDQAAGLAVSRMSLGVPAAAADEEAWFDIRHTSNWQLVYPLTDPSGALTAATGALAAGSYILPATTHVLTALRSNLQMAALKTPLNATLTYTLGDLTNAGPAGTGRISPDSLKVVALGSGGLWTEVAGATHDRTLQSFRFSPATTGVYALMATLSRQPADHRSVAIYPSPFDLRKDARMYLLNLPEDVKQVRIYAADSTLVRTLREIGYRDIDGKVFRAATWDGLGDQGQTLKMGLYFAEIPSTTGTVVKKLMLIR